MTEEENNNIDDPDLSQITEYLYVSSLPKDEDAEHIFALGIRLIVSMPVLQPPQVYREPPFQYVHCPSLDTPFAPIPQHILRRGVDAALPLIAGGDKVLVHCKAGMHRSVAMAACILIAEGYTAKEAMRLVDENREVADPYVRHIRKRIEIFESNWQEQ